MSSSPLSPAAIGKINEIHHEQLKRILNAKLLNGAADVDEHAIDAPDNVGEYLQGLRQQRSDRQLGRGPGEAERIGDLLNMADGVQRKEVSIQEIMASADAQHSAVLAKQWFVRESSNREKAFAKYALDLLPALLCTVPVRCKDFYLLPEQRLAILTMITALPVDVYVNCEIPREAMEVITPRGSRKMPFSVRYRLEKNKLPTFTIADYWCVRLRAAHALSPSTAPFDPLQHRLGQDHHGGDGGALAALLRPALECAQVELPRTAGGPHARGVQRPVQD